MVHVRDGIAVSCFLGLQIAASSFAFAQGEEAPISLGDTRANDLKVGADVAMEAGNFSEALRLYRDAYTLFPQPALLYNMGRAEERLGLYGDSLRSLEQFSRSASPELKARVPKLAELLAEVRAHVALVTLRSNVAGAKVVLRGKYVATTPVKWSLATTGGKAILDVSADGYMPYQKDLALEEGKNIIVDITLVPKGTAAALVFKRGVGAEPSAADVKGASPSHVRADVPKDGGSHSITSKWWFWTGIGVGVVSGIALAAVLLTPEKSAPRGDVSPGQASAALLRF